jgi:uncharacterized membrane protein
MEERRLVCMPTGVALRVVAGLALLAYALVAFISLHRGLSPLLPAAVGAYLLVRGLTSREVRHGGGS